MVNQVGNYTCMATGCTEVHLGQQLTRSADTSTSSSDASHTTSLGWPLGGAACRAKVRPAGTSLIGSVLPLESLHSRVMGGRYSPSIRSLLAMAARPSPCRAAWWDREHAHVPHSMVLSIGLFSRLAGAPSAPSRHAMDGSTCPERLRWLLECQQAD